jgi:hypothetical protein
MGTTVNELSVNGINYVPKGSQSVYDGELKIVVLQRGWVYIGRFSRIGDDCKLSDASCIRVWGTTKGLAELVNGPTKSTVLDKCLGLVEFDYLTVCFTISVNADKWKGQ